MPFHNLQIAHLADAGRCAESFPRCFFPILIGQNLAPVHGSDDTAFGPVTMHGALWNRLVPTTIMAADDISFD